MMQCNICTSFWFNSKVVRVALQYGFFPHIPSGLHVSYVNHQISIVRSRLLPMEGSIAVRVYMQLPPSS